uniref:tetraspanin-8-like n=1 Tax=Solea senegalensis TaxID=28829 RepID=UPI001CD8839F|nr:tetraspanin-8-like [Solea senegalensis]
MAVNKFIKYSLFTFNFLFFLGGIVIFGLVLHARANKERFQITDNHLPAIDLLVFVGAAMVILSFLGCCGAIRENRCLLALFFLGLLSVLLMMLAVGVMGVISRTAAAQEKMRLHVTQLLPLGKLPAGDQVAFQQIERNGFCCGLFRGHLDWGESEQVPRSCNCTDTSRDCTAVDGREVYATPCMVFLMTWMDRVSGSLMGIAFGFGAVMILGMIFSSVLCCQVVANKGSIF